MGEQPKFPPKGLGPSWNQGIIGDATLEFGGSGMVATAYGYPGLSATLIGTGVYDIRVPNVVARGLRIYPQAQAGEQKGPTGAQIGPLASGAAVTTPGFNVHMSHVGGPTGSALLNTTSPIANPSGVVGVGAGVGTGGSRAIFPPTGAIVNMLILGSPITRY
jgi:hypothetical protein